MKTATATHLLTQNGHRESLKSSHHKSIGLLPEYYRCVVIRLPRSGKTITTRLVITLPRSGNLLVTTQTRFDDSLSGHSLLCVLDKTPTYQRLDRTQTIARELRTHSQVCHELSITLCKNIFLMTDLSLTREASIGHHQKRKPASQLASLK